MNPSVMDGDFALTVHLPAMVVEKEVEGFEYDEFNQELPTTEQKDVVVTQWRIGKQRQIKVKMCPENYEPVKKLVESKLFQYVDATEAKLFEDSCKPTKAKS